MFRRTLMLPVVVGLVLAIVGSASAAIVRVRVEGKSQTIFGATQPRASATTALEALESASIGGEFYYHVQVTGFGPYVDQIGRNAAAGFGGWAFKVNGASPPVGADQVEVKDGDVVLWYWADFTEAGGPPTLELARERRRLLPRRCEERRRQQPSPSPPPSAWTPGASRCTAVARVPALTGASCGRLPSVRCGRTR